MKRYAILLLIIISVAVLGLSSCSLLPSETPPVGDGDGDTPPNGTPETGPDAEHTHSPAPAVAESVTAPTCYEIGSYDDVVYCSVCGEELSREKKTSEQLSHLFEDGACTHCGEPKFSEGLYLEPFGDRCWYLYGIGSCTDTDVVIPSRGPDGKPVTEIKPSAFRNCTEITSVTIPESVTSIEVNAFEGCTSLLSIFVPDSVTHIYSNVFRGCTALTEVKLGNGISEIPDAAFYECENLKSVTLPDGITHIGSSAFHTCKSLVTLDIPESVVEISAMAFYACISLESIELPEQLEFIGDSAFSSCYALKEITIPSKITSIKSATFFDCEGLVRVNLPIGINVIEDYAFDGCDKLFAVYYAGSREDWDKIKIYSPNDPLGNAALHCEGDNQKQAGKFPTLY